MLHNGPKPGAGQVLSRATLASRSSGDLAGHDDVAAAREDSSASAAVSSAPAEAPESKRVALQLHVAITSLCIQHGSSGSSIASLYTCAVAGMKAGLSLLPQRRTQVYPPHVSLPLKNVPIVLVDPLSFIQLGRR